MRALLLHNRWDVFQTAEDYVVWVIGLHCINVRVHQWRGYNACIMHARKSLHSEVLGFFRVVLAIRVPCREERPLRR